jgi:hypothetical protein
VSCQGEKTIQIDAALRRVELICGVITKGELIPWADAAIERLDRVPPALLDISLGSSLTEKDLISLLGKLGEQTDPVEIGAEVFGQFVQFLYSELKHKKRTPDEIASLLYRAAFQADRMVPEHAAEFCNWIDDEFSLVQQGLAERQAAEHALVNFLCGTTWVYHS